MVYPKDSPASPFTLDTEAEAERGPHQEGWPWRDKRPDEPVPLPRDGGIARVCGMDATATGGLNQ